MEEWRLWRGVRDPFRFWASYLSGHLTVLLSLDGGETFVDQIFKSPTSLRNYLERNTNTK